MLRDGEGETSSEIGVAWPNRYFIGFARYLMCSGLVVWVAGSYPEATR